MNTFETNWKTLDGKLTPWKFLPTKCFDFKISQVRVKLTAERRELWRMRGWTWPMSFSTDHWPIWDCQAAILFSLSFPCSQPVTEPFGTCQFQHKLCKTYKLIWKCFQSINYKFQNDLYLLHSQTISAAGGPPVEVQLSMSAKYSWSAHKDFYIWGWSVFLSVYICLSSLSVIKLDEPICEHTA